MRKLAVIVALIVVTCTVSAQDGGAFKYGIKAGMNTASMTNTTDGIPGASAKSVVGFNIGLMAQYMLNDQMGVESGLYYSTLGSKVTGTGFSEKVNPAYLQVPITFLYKFDMGNGLSLYPDLGIYMGYGVAGSLSADYVGISTTGKCFSNGDNDANFKAFDFGATFGLNLQYDKFVFGVGYDMGLTKVNNDNNVGGKDNYNRNLKVTIGYFFN